MGRQIRIADDEDDDCDDDGDGNSGGNDSSLRRLVDAGGERGGDVVMFITQTPNPNS